jgi:small subunit ribosomal protein S9
MKPLHVSGSRKTARARATIYPGKGKIRFNGLLIDNVQPEMIRLKILEPVYLLKAGSLDVDVDIQAQGGGQTGQAEAARVALARALVAHNKKLEAQFLKYDRSLLVPDVRAKETHKPNNHGKARAKRQKSYR